MIIRLATTDDSARLWALVVTFIADQAGHGAPDQRKALAAGIRWGIENDEAIVVAEEDGELVGFVVWTAFPASAEGEVAGLGTFVAESHRGKGVANAMRAFAKEHCRAKGHRCVVGAVMASNVAGFRAAMSSDAKVVGLLLRWAL